MVHGFKVGDVALVMSILAQKLCTLVELLLGEPGYRLIRIGRAVERSESEERNGAEPVYSKTTSQLERLTSARRTLQVSMNGQMRKLKKSKLLPAEWDGRAAKNERHVVSRTSHAQLLAQRQTNR